MQHKVLHQKPGVAHLEYPSWYSSTHTGLQHFGFRGEASGSPSFARSDLAVLNQGLRRGAFATRHKPLDRAARVLSVEAVTTYALTWARAFKFPEPSRVTLL